MELLEYEKRHIEFLEKNSSECTLFLKKNDVFPLDKPCSVALYGCGARQTVKGGTGSGDVASRFFVNCENGLKNKGFNVVTTEWMDKYDSFKKSTEREYIKECKRVAKRNKIMGGVFSMGYFEEEKNYTFKCDDNADLCVYVLARNSGEGNDRRNIKGDVLLSDKEVSDILYLNKKFNKFILVLNVGGVVDLSKVLEVSNILLLSQLGVVTGTILADILLGNSNPSGKLSTSWAKPLDYPFFNEFGDLNDTYYKEGLFVGYRYFDLGIKSALFPFGYGLSYSKFDISYKDASLVDDLMTVNVSIKNISKYAGKEVVMLYLGKPNDSIINPIKELCSYKKTKELKENEIDNLSLSFKLSDNASYDEANALYKILKGEYIIYLGNSSDSAIPVCKIIVNEDVITNKLNNKLGKSGFIDYLPTISKNTYDVPSFIFDGKCITTKKTSYKKDTYVDKEIEKLSNEDLALVCLGHHETGFAAIVGSSCKDVIGGAGQTVVKLPSITKSLTMADGPAGIRIKSAYGIDKKGIYDISLDPMMEKMIKFLPLAARPFIMPPKNRHGEIHYQYTTAIPIGTALAQSFNDELIAQIGDLVAEEMEIFNVDLWLAPALNIHRNILCGRNFEYYSEDPYLSGKIAGAMTRGVEAHKGRGVTIKHFAGNNQELNRNNNNSHVSERVFREIYLKGFEICIKDNNPKAIMTSYNLINGIHTSESYELINDILRNEWGYDGLVMTDWIQSGRSWCKKSIYPAPYASNNILAGNDLTMSGSPKDHKEIMKALKKGKLSREDLLYSASRIYRSILIQKN